MTHRGLHDLACPPPLHLLPHTAAIVAFFLSTDHTKLVLTSGLLLLQGFPSTQLLVTAAFHDFVFSSETTPQRVELVELNGLKLTLFDGLGQFLKHPMVSEALTTLSAYVAFL